MEAPVVLSTYYEGIQEAMRVFTNNLITHPIIKPLLKRLKKKKKYTTWKKWWRKNYGVVLVPVLVGGVVSFMWYKIKVKLSEEAIQHFIMEHYPLDIYDILQLRRNNFLSTRDVYAFKLLMDSETFNSPIPSQSSSSPLFTSSPSSSSSSSSSSSPLFTLSSSSLDPYGLGPQPRLSFELFEQFFSNSFLRPIHDSELLARLFSSLFKDEYNHLGLREWFVLLAMMSTGSQQERLGLCFDVLDSDHDGRIYYHEFCGFLLLITTMGWSYAKQTYVRDALFPPTFRRTTPQEMAHLLLLHVGVAPVRHRWASFWEGDEEEEGEDPMVDRETFLALPLALV